MNYKYLAIFILLFLLIYEIVDFNITHIEGLRRYELTNTCIVSFFVLFIYGLIPSKYKRLNKQFFKISTIFIISFYIVHFFNYVFYSFNIVDLSFFSSEYTLKAAKLSLCFFIALVLGIILTNKSFDDKPEESLNLNIIKIIPLFQTISLIIFYSFTDKRYFSAGGNSAVLNDIGWNPIGAVGNVICVACVIASVAAIYYRYKNNKHVTIKEYIKSFPLLLYVNTFVYLSLVLISGDRGPILDILFVVSSGYFLITNKKIKIVYIIVALFVAANVLSFLSYLRGNPEDLSIAKIEVVSNRMAEASEDGNIIYNLTDDLSDVVNSYHLVFEYTQRFGFIYGFGIIFQLLAFLPGIRSILYSLSGIDISILSTDFLATMLLGEDYGAGTTCVADVYYNLGLYGGIVAYFLFGVFIKKCDIALYLKSNNYLVIIISLCYLTKSIYLGRSTILQPINLFVYTYLIFIISNLIANKIFRFK